jgi:hypothetical protein
MAAIGSDQAVLELVTPDREAEFSRHAVAIEHERARRQFERGFVRDPGEILRKKLFDPLVDRRSVVAQQACFLAQTFEHPERKSGHRRIGRVV